MMRPEPRILDMELIAWCAIQTRVIRQRHVGITANTKTTNRRECPCRSLAIYPSKRSRIVAVFQ